MDRQISCLICGKKLNPEDLESHIRQYHFMEYDLYYELSKLSLKTKKCWKCGGSLMPICPYSDIFYLPCFNCTTSKSQLLEKTQNIIEQLTNYLKLIKISKSAQLFLSNDDIIRKTFPHTLTEFDTVVDTLIKNQKKLDNISYFNIKRINNYSPYEISTRNINNLDIFTINNNQHIVLNGKKYRVLLPEPCEYNPKNHTKYSILNLNSTKTSKRVKLADKSCLKLWGNSIFALQNIDDDSDILESFENISQEELSILKYSILKNKNTFTILAKIYLELCKFCNVLSDNVFIKNTIPISNTNNINLFYFSWFKEKNQWETDSIINLTVF